MTAIMTIKDQMPASTMSFLDMKAKRIKELSEKWAENTIDLGKEFKQARDRFPVAHPNNPKSARPGWYEWVAKNTDWKPAHVSSFIRIAEKFDRSRGAIGLTWKVLNYLSSDNTPDAVVQEVVSRSKSGERIGLDKAKQIARPHLPTRAEAIRQAAETGRLVAARDGHLYSGVPEDEMAAYSERRSAVYGVRRAVKDIADCPFNAAEWVKMAEDHWLTEFRLNDLDTAIRWLTKVRPLLEKRQKVIGE